MSDIKSQNKAIALFDYLQGVLNLGLKNHRTIDEHGEFVLYGNDIPSVDGISTMNSQKSESVWLSVQSTEIPEPPEPDDAIKPWIVFPSDSVNEIQTRGLAVLKEKEDEFFLDNQRTSLFSEYVESWNQWVVENEIRQSVYKIYDSLFQVADKLKYDVQFELVCGFGFLLWSVDGREIRYPLITQRMVIEHLAADGIINIVIDDDSEMQLEPVILSNFDLKDATEIKRKLAEIDFNPSQKDNFKELYKEIGGRLSSNSQIKDCLDIRNLKSNDRVQIVNTWSFFIRKRKQDALIRNINEFREKLKNDKVKLSPGILMFLDETEKDRCKSHDEKLVEHDEIGALMDKRILFPRQANQEQVRIIDKISNSNGVVVLGPPGTGKSHTIANLICHFMAEGKRVLVTSQKDQALQVLHKLIPEELQPLCISAYSNIRNSKDRLTLAVTKINEIASGSLRSSVEKEVELFEKNLEKYASELQETQNILSRLVSLQNWKIVDWNGELREPAPLIEKLKAENLVHVWFDDNIEYATIVDSRDDHSFVKLDVKTPITESVIEELKGLQLKLNNSLYDLSFNLPEAKQLIDIESFRKMSDDLTKMSILRIEMDRLVNCLIFKNEDNALIDNAVKEVEKALQVYKQINSDWQRSILDSLNSGTIDLKKVKRSISKFEKLTKLVSAQLMEQELDEKINLNTTLNLIDLKTIVDEAITRVGSGKKPYGLLSSGTKKSLLNAIRINAKPPVLLSDWKKVVCYIDMLLNANDLRNGWNNFVDNAGVVDDDLKLNESKEITEDETEQLIKMVEMLKAPVAYFKDRLPRLRGKLDTVIARVDNVMADNSLETILKVLLLKKDLLNFQESKDQWQQLNDYLHKLIDPENLHCMVNPHSMIKEMIESLNLIDVDPEKVIETWKLCYQKILLLESREKEYQRYTQLVSILGESVPKWAEECVKGEMTHEDMFPGDWQELLFYSALKKYLNNMVKSVDDIERFETKQKMLVRFLLDTKRKLVLARTKLGIITNTSVENLQALEEWRISVKKLGKGKGKLAWKRERAVKLAMGKAKDAVPVWIMPVYKVSETLPAEFGCFDVVIVDESSQCDVRTLPVLARGNKVIVVGDPEQISPEGVGVAEDKIEALISTHLNGIEHKSYFDVKTSLYDIAKIKFSGHGELMLREHFRCVPEIIGFCNHLCYQDRISPLRNPLSKERLEPVLDAVFVEDGRREDGVDVNRAEADKICLKLKEIVEDPKYRGRTVGVVSLTGNDQAKYISQIINKYLTTTQREACDFHVGDAYAFQGDERDIIILSMVVGKDDTKRYVSLTRESYKQRFNVAVSRAKNKIILFHSVQLGNDIQNPEDLRYILLDYILNNKSDASRCGDETLDHLNQFEKRVYNMLTERGYSVKPKFVVGNKCIDLVVEGETARVAIECEGDSIGAESEWVDEQIKTRQLERAGWEFVRIWSSSFTANPELSMNHIFEKLEASGIKQACSPEQSHQQ